MKDRCGKSLFLAALLIIAAALVTRTAPVQAQGASPEESLRKSYPRLKVERVSPSPVKGLYEVEGQGRIFYYAPDGDYLIVGDLYAKDGRNLSQERIEQKMAARLKELPLDKAVRIGSGPNTVIEFTDPDNPHGRKAAQFLAGRTDVTRHVFLIVSPGSRKAEPKIRYILCAKDQAAAYAEAVAGKLDTMKFKVCDAPGQQETLREHAMAASHIGVRGTPFFFVNGKPVRGANTTLIQQILEKAPEGK